MTPGERAIATRVFGAAIDFDRVTVRHAKWFALQPAWIVMAPDGHIWFHPNGGLWRSDFAAPQALDLRALLVHELVHVWQHQHGIRLPLQRPPLPRYAYTLKPGKRFGAYGLEQQACIVEDAYRLSEGGAAPAAAASYAAVWPFVTPCPPLPLPR